MTDSFVIPDIDGAFTATATARFDNVGGGSYQRIFDLGDGPDSNNIWLGQVGNTHDMAFEILDGATKYRIVATNAIVQGRQATWTANVDKDGVMRLFENGVLVAQGQGVVPKDVPRTNAFVGHSNWTYDSPLAGQVTSLEVGSNKGGSRRRSSPAYRRSPRC